MRPDEFLQAAAEAGRKGQQEREQRFLEQSRDRLGRILEKKCTTAFIGALSCFEKFFGDLWGHGKRAADLSEEEAAWLERWQQCRTEVLNKGNAQTRAVRAELDNHSVAWGRHKLEMRTDGQQEDV